MDTKKRLQKAVDSIDINCKKCVVIRKGGSKFLSLCDSCGKKATEIYRGKKAL